MAQVAPLQQSTELVHAEPIPLQAEVAPQVPLVQIWLQQAAENEQVLPLAVHNVPASPPAEPPSDKPPSRPGFTPPSPPLPPVSVNGRQTWPMQLRPPQQFASVVQAVPAVEQLFV